MEQSPGVKLLLGEPKKAVITFSKIMIIAMLLNSLYSVVDVIWIAGLSESALAAIGFVHPVYLAVIGIGTALGAGATTVISTYIGEAKKNYTNNASIHIILLIIIISIFLTIFLHFFLADMILLMDGDLLLNSSLSYGNTLFLGTILIIFVNTSTGIFRAEANSKKAIYAISIGLIINIILDPLFIYYFNFAIKGAAISTLISLAIVSILFIYLFKKNSYIDFNFKFFKPSKKILKGILNIFIPSSLENLLMPFFTGLLNLVLMIVLSEEGVAIFTGGWQVINLIMTPLITLSLAMIAIIAANFGRKNYKNIIVLQNYVLKVSIILAIILSIIVFILAPYIGDLFSSSPHTADIDEYISNFLRITCVYYLFLPLGLSANSIFKGIGKGYTSMAITFFRTILTQGIAIFILVFVLNLEEEGIWYGIILGSSVGCIISYLFSKYYVKRLITYNDL